MSVPLACGLCLDQEMFGLFPFSFYWVLVLVLWSLLPGPILALIAKVKKERLPPLPHRYFLPGIGLSFLLAPLTMGAISMPLAIACVIGMLLMARDYRRTALRLAELSPMAHRARAMQRVFLTLYVALIPVAYARLWWQSH